jgi:CubicO group peptidase (beta-lactamase class C family)
VKVTRDGNHLRFVLPGDGGEFRGKLEKAGNTIRGYWIQPEGKILENKYATPVELRPVIPSVWRGRIVPLGQRISVYADITDSGDGKLSAVLANPEMNFFRNRVFAITREGDKVHLDAKGWKIDGTYDAKTDTLSLQLADFLPPFQFSRREKNAPGFYPRTPGDTVYRYREPIADGDGWTTATLAQEGLDERPIRELVEQILNADPANTSLSIHSLLIARHGRLVLEEYFHGYDSQRPHDMRSAGKTFAPVLVGLAHERGAKLSPQTPVYPLFSQYKSFENWDERKQKITLRDIMTMTAGNACNDYDDDSPGNEDRMQQSSKDWYKYTLNLPMLRSPGGENAVYCSGDLNLVGGAVASATGTWLPEFFDENLARPLQFGRYYLNLMPDGQAYMGGGAHVLPRDELKLGQLFLDGGVWHGKRILDRAWVEESMSMHSKFDPKYSLGQEHEYGYGWHINYLNSGGKTYRAVAAGGNGGQFVVIVPALDMVVGINGGAYGQFSNWFKWELELIPKFIIAAAGQESQSHGR